MADATTNEEPTKATAPELAADTWHLRVSYDGTAFHGWQIQPQQRTVQGELQARLRRLFRVPELRITGSSRTDAGVHALDQQVSFAAPTPADLDPDGVRRTLNRWLPADIRVQEACRREPGFHARHSAMAKAYVYVLCRAEKCHPLLARFTWHCPVPLDVAAMRAAASIMEGEHDFASFAVNPHREIDSTVRALYRLEVTDHGQWIYVTALGERFLYKMVRSLVGFLVHVGKGAATPEDTLAVLAARDRCAAADSAPAPGLFLARVFYEPDRWHDYQPPLPPWAAASFR